jgi:hypothetical protein
LWTQIKIQIQEAIEAALSTKQAARYLGVSPGTLTVWRARRSGPPCTYSGTKPVYYLSALIGWQKECARRMLLRVRQNSPSENKGTYDQK